MRFIILLLLDNSRNYNEESAVQSNCVKTYIGKAGFHNCITPKR